MIKNVYFFGPSDNCVCVCLNFNKAGVSSFSIRSKWFVIITMPNQMYSRDGLKQVPWSPSFPWISEFPQAVETLNLFWNIMRHTERYKGSMSIWHFAMLCSNNVAEAEAAAFGLQVSCRYDHGACKYG